jgi:hypothetical protein
MSRAMSFGWRRPWRPGLNGHTVRHLSRTDGRSFVRLLEDCGHCDRAGSGRHFCALLRIWGNRTLGDLLSMSGRRRCWTRSSGRRRGRRWLDGHESDGSFWFRDWNRGRAAGLDFRWILGWVGSRWDKAPYLLCPVLVCGWNGLSRHAPQSGTRRFGSGGFLPSSWAGCGRGSRLRRWTRDHGGVALGYGGDRGGEGRSGSVGAGEVTPSRRRSEFDG